MQTVVLYTASDAAHYLDITRHYFMSLVKKNEILALPRMHPPRFLQTELDAYKSRKRAKDQEEMARKALLLLDAQLSSRQRSICEKLAAHQYPASIARSLGVSRQAIHQQLERVRAKLAGLA